MGELAGALLSQPTLRHNPNMTINATDPVSVDGTDRRGRDDFRRRVNRMVRRIPEMGIFSTLVLLVGVFSIGADNFRTVDSYTSILTVAANVGIVALGCGFLMISGEFDISVGSVYLIATLFFAQMANAGLVPPLAFLVTLVLCAVIGLVNGLITVNLRIPSFIVTLAAMMFYRGLHIILTRGFSVSYKADKAFLDMVAGITFSLMRNTVIWWILLAIILQVVLAKTRYGNWVLATGGDAQAARNSGVPVSRVKVINFALCSLLAGFAGAANMARFLTSQSQLGMGMEFEAITAAVIGGTLLMGGKGSMAGAVLGAIFVSVIRSGLIFFGYSSYIYMPVTGIILMLAVIINRGFSNFQLLQFQRSDA